MRNNRSNDSFALIFAVAVCAALLLIITGFYFYNQVIKPLIASSMEYGFADNIDDAAAVSEGNNSVVSAVSEPEEQEKIEKLNIDFANDWEDKSENKEPQSLDLKNVKNIKNNVEIKEPEKPESIKKFVKAANKRPVKKSKNKKSNLSAYKVKAISENKADLLPDNTGASLDDLNAKMNKKKPEKHFDGGKGFIGDIYRGAKKILDKTDETTLRTSRKVIGDATNLDIEKAKIRPDGGGAKLYLDLSPNIFKNKNKLKNN